MTVRAEPAWAEAGRDRPPPAATEAVTVGFGRAGPGGSGPGYVPGQPNGQAGQPGAVPDRRRSRWPAVLVSGGAVVVAAAAAVIATVVLHGTGQPGRAQGPGAGSSSSRSAGMPNARSPHAVVPASWTTYNDPSGFSVKLPPGWAATSIASQEVRFTGTPAGFSVTVAWGYHPLPDALADWRQQAEAKAASDPTYQQIRVQRVAYRGYNAADWEFTNVYQGVLTHVLDRTFIVKPGRLAYAIELSGPAARWRAVRWMWKPLMDSFRPAG